LGRYVGSLDERFGQKNRLAESETMSLLPEEFGVEVVVNGIDAAASVEPGKVVVSDVKVRLLQH